MSLSVAVPNLNGGKYLRQCLNSIRLQTHPPDELFVVDGGSTDMTWEVLEKFPNVVVLKDEAKGVAPALNLALKKSSGEFFAQVSADCWLHPLMYERCIDLLQKEPELSMVYTGWYIVDEGGHLIGVSRQPFVFDRALLLNGNYIDANSMVMRTECVTEFDTRTKYHFDWLLPLQLSMMHPVKYIEKPLFYYRQGVPGQVTSLGEKLQQDFKKAKQIVERELT